MLPGRAIVVTYSVMQALDHVGDAFETIAKSFNGLAGSVVDLKGAIQVKFAMFSHLPELQDTHVNCLRDCVV